MPGKDVVPTSPARDLALAAAGPEVRRLAAAAADYAEASQAASTRRAYRSAWRAFSTWCADHQAEPLPTPPGLVILYLSDQAVRLKVTTLSLHMAAIDSFNLDAGFEKPRSAELTKVWAGIRREHGRPPNKKRALVIEDLQRVVKKLPSDLQGLRDKALLLLCFAAALRRSELVALHLDDGRPSEASARLQFVAGGAAIRLDRSKTDQLGEGQVIGVPHGKTKLCPVAALQAWLRAASITTGPLFRPIDRHGHVAGGALSGRAIADIVKRACARCGLDPAVFSGHSMRAGFATTAAARGAEIELIMRQTRHKKVDTVRGYIREGELFARNAASKVGL